MTKSFRNKAPASNQRIAFDKRMIVPDKAVAKRRQVDEKSRRDDDEKRAGAREMQPVTDQFYGDRAGALEDPFGHRWTIATHVEDVSPDEMERRMRAMQPGG